MRISDLFDIDDDGKIDNIETGTADATLSDTGQIHLNSTDEQLSADPEGTCTQLIVEIWFHNEED